MRGGASPHVEASLSPRHLETLTASVTEAEGRSLLGGSFGTGALGGLRGGEGATTGTGSSAAMAAAGSWDTGGQHSSPGGRRGAPGLPLDVDATTSLELGGRTGCQVCFFGEGVGLALLTGLHARPKANIKTSDRSVYRACFRGCANCAPRDGRRKESSGLP